MNGSTNFSKTTYTKLKENTFSGVTGRTETAMAETMDEILKLFAKNGPYVITL
jgi:hypothetical protein